MRALSVLALFASPGVADTQICANDVPGHAAPAAFRLAGTNADGGSLSSTTAIWDLILLWYLEWIGTILDEAFAELDELESPEQWMNDIQLLYIENGLPNGLSFLERLLFVMAIEEVLDLLDAAPHTVDPAAIADFESTLSSMKSDLGFGPPD